MASVPEPKAPRPRVPRPTGEKFDPAKALLQAKELYPTVMARLAE